MKNQILNFIIGIIFFNLGIALSKTTKLGMSIVSSVPNSISIVTNIKLGIMVFLMSFLYILVQTIIYKKIKLKVILQITFGFISGVLIELFLFLFSEIVLTNDYIRYATMIISTPIIGLGFVYLMKSNLIMSPQGGCVVAFDLLHNKDIKYTKYIFDTIHLVFSVSILLIFNNGIIKDLGIGTLYTYLTLGYYISFFKKQLSN